MIYKLIKRTIISVCLFFMFGMYLNGMLNGGNINWQINSFKEGWIEIAIIFMAFLWSLNIEYQ